MYNKSDKYNFVLIPTSSGDVNKCKSIGNHDRVFSTTNYIPAIEAKELRARAGELQKRLVKQGHIVCAKILTLESKYLAELDKDDTLYISAHGSPWLIGTEDKGININPKALAYLLSNAGLSNKIGTIKLMCCDSATRLINDSNVLLESYAETFQKTLESLGYGDTDVVGYYGNITEVVDTKESHTKILIKAQKGDIVGDRYLRASDLRFFCLAKSSQRNQLAITNSNNSALDLARDNELTAIPVSKYWGA